MLEVKFYDKVDDALLKLAVIISQSNGKWVFCKHKDRDTYEVPGGHRESGEDILVTARRELQEETGATRFDLKPVCVYSVTGQNQVNQTHHLIVCEVDGKIVASCACVIIPNLTRNVIVPVVPCVKSPERNRKELC